MAAQFLAGARHAIGVHRLLDTLASGETIITGVGCVGGETGRMGAKGGAVAEIIADMVGGELKI